MLRAAIVGCGGRGRKHAQGYTACPGVELVAASDPFADAREAFAQSFGVPAVYGDYEEMLRQEKPDILSVCTWTPLHKEMVIAGVDAGVRAIHCEKPIASTWKDSVELVEACDRAGVTITFCHQRRFEAPYVTARRLVGEGAIGAVKRLEGFCSNMFDWGTHWFDMFFYYNQETPADWVMAQVDYSRPRDVFGVPVDTYGISYIHYSNDVFGLIITGEAMGRDCDNRIVGTDGVILVNARDPKVVLWRAGKEREVVPTDTPPFAPDPTTATIFDLVDALSTGREPELAGRKALAATQLIFATYESARRGGRIALPL